MLPPFIIEQIRRREDKTQEAEQPRLELPLSYGPPPRGPSIDDDDPNRGVVTIDLGLTSPEHIRSGRRGASCTRVRPP
jgi:hypothetical protein